MSTLETWALTSVSDVKESLGIASSDLSWDNLIIRKINQATDAIEKYCGRRFKETTYTQEEYDAPNSDQLIIRQRPVTTSQAFLFEIRNNSLNTNDWSTVDSQLYFVDNNAGVIDLDFNANGKWNRWRVTYSAGYATIPSDLAEACATLAAYYVLNAGAGDIGKLEIREGSRMVRYAQTGLSFATIMQNLGIDQIINAYANSPLLLDS